MGLWQSVFGGSEGYSITQQGKTTKYDGDGNIIGVIDNPNNVLPVEPKTYAEGTGLLSKAKQTISTGISQFKTYIPDIDFASVFQGGETQAPSTGATNAERLNSSESHTPDANECAWWNVGCKAANAAAATGAFIQSTMTKAIILVVVVAVAAIFITSYASAKANKVA